MTYKAPANSRTGSPLSRIAAMIATLLLLHPLAYGPAVYLQKRRWVPPVVIESIFAPEIHFLVHCKERFPKLREMYASYVVWFLVQATRADVEEMESKLMKFSS